MTRLRHALGTVVTALVLVASVAFLVASVRGVRLLPVLTGSMTPYAPAGSLVLTVPVPGDDVQVGEVVAFRPPAPWTVMGDRPVMHRVHALGHTGQARWMTTEGDANPAPDPWRVALDGPTFERAVFVVPWAGRLVAAGPWAALALVLGAAAALTGVRRLSRLQTVRIQSIPLHARGHRAY